MEGKGKDRSILRRSLLHDINISSILNLNRGLVSPQFHVMHETTIFSVPLASQSRVLKERRRSKKLIINQIQTLSRTMKQLENHSLKRDKRSSLKRDVSLCITLKEIKGQNNTRQNLETLPGGEKSCSTYHSRRYLHIQEVLNEAGNKNTKKSSKEANAIKNNAIFYLATAHSRDNMWKLSNKRTAQCEKYIESEVFCYVTY